MADALPINFCGEPNEILAQLKRCREQIGAGVVVPDRGSEYPDELMGGSRSGLYAEAEPASRPVV